MPLTCFTESPYNLTEKLLDSLLSVVSFYVKITEIFLQSTFCLGLQENHNFNKYNYIYF